MRRRLFDNISWELAIRMSTCIMASALGVFSFLLALKKETNDCLGGDSLAYSLMALGGTTTVFAVWTGVMAVFYALTTEPAAAARHLEGEGVPLVTPGVNPLFAMESHGDEGLPPYSELPSPAQ